MILKRLGDIIHFHIPSLKLQQIIVNCSIGLDPAKRNATGGTKLINEIILYLYI